VSKLFGNLFVVTANHVRFWFDDVFGTTRDKARGIVGLEVSGFRFWFENREEIRFLRRLCTICTSDFCKNYHFFKKAATYSSLSLLTFHS